MYGPSPCDYKDYDPGPLDGDYFKVELLYDIEDEMKVLIKELYENHYCNLENVHKAIHAICGLIDMKRPAGYPLMKQAPIKKDDLFQLGADLARITNELNKAEIL